MKKIIIPVIFVWFAGAFAMSIYYGIQRKANCIEHEGFLKGWLWCKTDPVTGLEFSSNRIELFVRGLGWPIEILGISPSSQNGELDEETPDSLAIVATEEQFGSAMCALKEMPREALTELQRTVWQYLMDHDQTKMIQALEVDEVPFYLSNCFKKYAVRTMSIRTSTQDLKHFYNASERALLLTLMVEAVSNVANEQQIKKVANEARVEIQQRNEQYYH